MYYSRCPCLVRQGVTALLGMHSGWLSRKELGLLIYTDDVRTTRGKAAFHETLHLWAGGAPASRGLGAK
jgi:hypothetical protein